MTIPAVYIFAVFGASVVALIGGVWFLSGLLCVCVYSLSVCVGFSSSPFLSLSVSMCVHSG